MNEYERKWDDRIYGTFTYDYTEFNISSFGVCYIGFKNYGKDIQIPEGIVNCTSMFWHKDILTPPKIPSSVTNVNSMFEECLHLQYPPVIPKTVKFSQHVLRGTKFDRFYIDSLLCMNHKRFRDYKKSLENLFYEYYIISTV